MSARKRRATPQAAAGHVDIARDVDIRTPAGFAGRPLQPSGPPPKVAGQRGSSEDDLPLWLNHAQDRGVGRGLNPAPDERRPAVSEYDERAAVTTTTRES